MAEVLFRAHATAAGAGPALHVHSAGLLDGGWPASDHGVTAMASRGLDTAGHESRQLTLTMATAADLLVGMAREHIREAVLLAPERFFRMYTLKELVRRGEQAGARAPDQAIDEWLMKVHAGRTHGHLLGRSDDDDVADPIGRSKSHYERTAAELDDLTARLAALLWPGGD